MKILIPEMIDPLYKKKYWDAIRGDDLVDGLDWVGFDWCVNLVYQRSARTLQRILEEKPDGRIRLKTLQKIAGNGSIIFVEKLNDCYQKFHESLHSFLTFQRGWSRWNENDEVGYLYDRCGSLIYYALLARNLPVTLSQ